MLKQLEEIYFKTVVPNLHRPAEHLRYSPSYRRTPTCCPKKKGPSILSISRLFKDVCLHFQGRNNIFNDAGTFSRTLLAIQGRSVEIHSKQDCNHERFLNFYKSENFRRTPESALSNPKGSIEPRLGTTALAAAK